MKLQPIDISKTASAASIVFESLRKAIIEGELVEGTPLRQDEIARLFNTSRIPVREAISRLEEKGLVTSQRFKGAVVAGLDLDDGPLGTRGHGSAPAFRPERHTPWPHGHPCRGRGRRRGGG